EQCGHRATSRACPRTGRKRAPSPRDARTRRDGFTRMGRRAASEPTFAFAGARAAHGAGVVAEHGKALAGGIGSRAGCAALIAARVATDALDTESAVAVATVLTGKPLGEVRLTGSRARAMRPVGTVGIGGAATRARVGIATGGRPIDARLRAAALPVAQE